MNAPPRLAELDALRGVAVLMVLAYHYTTRFGELFPRFAWGDFPLGNYGPQLFFVISGFVIFMTLEHTARPLDFVFARFSRLYPAYWAALLLTSATLWLLGGPLAPPSLPQLEANLTMLPGVLHVAFVDGVYWTLEVELFFYAMALAAFATGLARRAELLVLGWLALSALHASALWPRHVEALPAAGLAARLLVLEFAPFFALGVLFYRLYRGHGRRAGNYALVAAAFALVAHTQPASVSLMIAAGCAVLWKVAHGGLALLRFPPLVFVGTVSYSLYLLHQKIGQAALFEMSRRGWGPAARLAAATALALLLAALLTFLVEKPAMAALRRWYRARRRRGAAIVRPAS